MRHRIAPEQVFLLLALVIVSCLMAGQMWGTAFTCDDDMYAATAWQRAGGDVHGWSAVWTVSWNAYLYEGRFYQVLLYALWQMPYLLGSFELVNAVRIGTLLFTFASFAAMLTSVTRSLSLGLYCSILCAGLIEAKYNYNSFRAYPLWFNLALGILFAAILLFQEGMVRGKSRWVHGAAVIYFGSLLFYEPILFYCVVFFALAYAHNRSSPRSRIATAARAFATVWPIGASAVLYLMLYAGFKYWHPGSYPGTKVSLASFREVARTIVGFSLSGLNFQGILHMNPQLRAVAMLAALLVLAAAFLSMRRLSRDAAPSRLLPHAGMGAICMLLPNILYGFTERYRHWLANIGDCYLGSFYSSFAEAVVIATISILIVQVAARVRMELTLAVVIAGFFGIAAYSNVSQTVTFFQVHRENRKIWDLVEASISATGGPSQAAVLVAATLNHLRQLSPAIYNYWDFYFTDKLGHPIHVSSKLSEFGSLPPSVKSGPVFGYICRYSPELQSGLFALGPLDLNVWQDEGRLVAHNVQAGVLGGARSLSVFEKTDEQHARGIADHAALQFTIENQPVDLDRLVLQR